MDKIQLLEEIISELTGQLHSLFQETSGDLTGDSSLAETAEELKADQYLEGATQKRRNELEEKIQKLKKFSLKNFSSGDGISPGHLVEALINDQKKKWYFILPTASGLHIDFNGLEVHVVTPESPLGKQLMSSNPGEGFELKIGDHETFVDVLKVL